MSSAVTHCPICTGLPGSPFFSLANAPVTCASVFATREEALAIPRAAVALVACQVCGFAYNELFDPALAQAGAAYESSQGASVQFSTFARTLAGDWINRYGLSGQTLLEVGCGSGNFADALLAAGAGSILGIDPLAPAEQTEPGKEFIADLFDERYLDAPGAALVCRHTLEHVQDVAAFLHVTHAWAARQPGRIVLFEIPDAERIFEERAFWDVYYEHCNYFTPATLRGAFERAGFEVLRLERTYGNQYLVLEAVVRSEPQLPPFRSDTTAHARCEQFGHDVRHAIARCESALGKLLSDAPLVLWQGASKTVGFLSALSKPERIACAIDLSPSRQGKFLPVSGLAVYAPEELKRLQPRDIVLMNPVYLEEVRALVATLGVRAQVHAVNELLAASR